MRTASDHRQRRSRQRPRPRPCGSPRPADSAATTPGRPRRRRGQGPRRRHPVRYAQGLKAVDTIVDADGTSHVRMNRTYHGLEVVGGDLVVHQTRAGAWKGTSQTLARTPQPRGHPRGHGRGGRRQGAGAQRGHPQHQEHQGRRLHPRRRRHRCHPPSGMEGDERRRRPTARRAAWRRTSTRSRARSSAPSRRSSTSTAPARPSTAAPSRCSVTQSGSTYQLKNADRAAAPTRPT